MNGSVVSERKFPLISRSYGVCYVSGASSSVVTLHPAVSPSYPLTPNPHLHSPSPLSHFFSNPNPSGTPRTLTDSPAVALCVWHGRTTHHITLHFLLRLTKGECHKTHRTDPVTQFSLINPKPSYDFGPFLDRAPHSDCIPQVCCCTLEHTKLHPPEDLCSSHYNLQYWKLFQLCGLVTFSSCGHGAPTT